MMNKKFLPYCRFAASLYVVACSGCASFFGPYGFDKNYRPARGEEKQSVGQPVEKSLAPVPNATVSTAQPEYDVSAITSATVVPAAIDATEDTTSVEFAPVETEKPKAATATSDDDENPFAQMERERLLQVSDTSSNSTASRQKQTIQTSFGTFHPSEARVPTKTNEDVTDVVVGASPITDAYPDEYIFDGGDRDHPVHYFGGEMQGLDTEDTVVEFKDHEGSNHVKASNRVAVYAPRFGAVQSVSGPGIGIKYDKAVGAIDVAGIKALLEERQLQANIHQSGFSGLASNNSASGIEIAQPAHMSRRAESALQSRKIDQGMESRIARGPGLLRTSEVHELNLQILEPGNSNNTTGINIAGSTSQATETYSTFRVQSTVGSEEGGRKGEIHITKNASPLVAKAGDVVTFTINFKNVGDYNVSDVRIIDNLTPRLTYVAGSGRVKVAGGEGGELIVAPNKEGSQTMIFELDNPLPGGRGGTITFQARVL